MKSGWRMAAVALLGVALVAAAACSSDSKGAKTVATSPTTAAVKGQVTPFPTPKIVGSAISSTKGYSATLPKDWKVHANVVQTSDASVDAFFEPLQPGASVQPNISVNCIVVKSKDPKAYADGIKTNTVRQGLNKDIQVSQRPISGVTAEVLSYRFESQQGKQTQLDPQGTPVAATPPLDKTDYLFSDRHCDWQLTTVTGAGDRAKYQTTFDTFLDSFKLEP